MNLFKRILLIIPGLFSCVGCDQVTKSLARQRLPKWGSISFLGDLFRLEYVENPGAFLSWGAEATRDVRYWVFIILVGLLVAGALVYVVTARKLTRPKTIALSLVIAGGLGNLMDRIRNDGRVVDFLNVGIGSLRSGIFNVADVAIFAGVIWFLVIFRKNGGQEETIR